MGQDNQYSGIRTDGGAYVGGNVETQGHFVGRDFITNTVVTQFFNHPSFLYWVLCLALLGLYLILWLGLSAAGVENSFTKPLDLAVNYLKSPSMGSPGDRIMIEEPSPTPTSEQAGVAGPTMTPTPTPGQASELQCIARGNLTLYDRNYWPPSSVPLRVTVPDGTTIIPIGWDGDNLSPWVILEYSGIRGWYSANTKDDSYFECGNVGILPIYTSLSPVVTDTPTPVATNTPIPVPTVSNACVITIINDLVQLKSEPDVFSRDLGRVPAGNHVPLEHLIVQTNTGERAWFKLLVDTRVGWIENNGWTIEFKTPACP